MSEWCNIKEILESVETMTPTELRANRLMIPWFRKSIRTYPAEFRGNNRWAPAGVMPKGNRGRKRKKKVIDDVARTRARTKRGRDEAVARHRAANAARSIGAKRTIEEVIASLSPKERAALVASPHVISAVEKIVEAMLFRFSQ